MSVILYTTPTCGFCHQLKNYLDQRGVAYTEFDVSRNRDAVVEMVRISGQQGVPVLVVDGQVVVGFDRPRIDRLLAQSTTRLGAAIADATRFAAQKGLALPAGAYVGRVDSGSVASQAGLGVGDVITSLDGQPITTDRDVDRILTTIDRGQVAPAVVWRRGQTLSLILRF